MSPLSTADSFNVEELPSLLLGKLAAAETGNAFQNLIDELPGGIFVKDEAGRFIVTNKYVETALGQDRNQMIGKTDIDVFGNKVGRRFQETDCEVWQSPNRFSRKIEKIPTMEGPRYYLTTKKIIPNFIRGAGEVLIGFSSDVTSQILTEKKLAAANDFSNKMQDLSPNIVFLLNLNTRYISRSNKAFERLLGYKQSVLEKEAKFWLSIMSPEDKAKQKIRFDKLRRMHKEEVITREIRYRKANGGYLWTKTMISPFEFDQEGEVQVVMVSIENIHRIKILQEKYRKESYYDHLTRIYNRRYFVMRLSKKLQSKRKFTLLFIDLNKFKKINDTYGHDMGDKVLIDTAKRLRSVFRGQKDVVARLGGDEFVVMLDGELGKGDNKSVVKRLKAQYIFPFELGDKLIEYRPSIGAVTIRGEEGMSPEVVLQQADAAMYEAKKMDNLEIITLVKNKPKIIEEGNVELI